MALTPIENCPDPVSVELNPKSYAMKYQREWGDLVVTSGSIDCPIIGRRVRILFAATDQ